jgi:hypothetical protein
MISVLERIASHQERQSLYMEQMLQAQQAMLAGGVRGGAFGGGGGDVGGGVGGGGGDVNVGARERHQPPTANVEDERPRQRRRQEQQQQQQEVADAGAHVRVAPPRVQAPRTQRTVANSLNEGGVTLVTIKGCPVSFRHLEQQWFIQKLNLYLTPAARKPFDANTKNAWTKWSRLYNLLLETAGFPVLKAGTSPFPRGMSRVVIQQRMTAAAESLDSLREEQNMNQFYRDYAATLAQGRQRRAGI